MGLFFAFGLCAKGGNPIPTLGPRSTHVQGALLIVSRRPGLPCYGRATDLLRVPPPRGAPRGAPSARRERVRFRPMPPRSCHGSATAHRSFTASGCPICRESVGFLSGQATRPALAEYLRFPCGDWPQAKCGRAPAARPPRRPGRRRWPRRSPWSASRCRAQAGSSARR